MELREVKAPAAWLALATAEDDVSWK